MNELVISITKRRDFGTVESLSVNNTMLENLFYTYPYDDKYDLFFDFNNGFFRVYNNAKTSNFIIKSEIFNNHQKWWKEMYFEVFRSDKQTIWGYNSYGKRDCGLISKDDLIASLQTRKIMCEITHDYLLLDGYLLKWELKQDNVFSYLVWNIQEFAGDNE